MVRGKNEEVYLLHDRCCVSWHNHFCGGASPSIGQVPIAAGRLPAGAMHQYLPLDVPAFLARFAEGSLLRVFIQFDMTAERQPFPKLSVVDDQHSGCMDDKDGDGEIYFVMDVRHVGRIVTDATLGAKRNLP